MADRVPDDIALAARGADTDALRAWLEAGGDANGRGYIAPPPIPVAGERTTMPLLLLVARTYHYGRPFAQRDCIRLLLEHGADVNYVHDWSQNSDWAGWGHPEATALTLCAEEWRYAAAQELISNGADSSRIIQTALLDDTLLRMMLVAGADLFCPNDYLGDHYYGDPDQTPLDYARRSIAEYERSGHDSLMRSYENTVSILEGVRLAGSYKQYILQDYKELLRLRSLLARGRALIGPQTPQTVARLFGGRADPAASSRRATRRHQPPPNRAAGVPDPVFWKVMEFWRLGDWRRPAGNQTRR
jgi:hypothetical protein